MLMPEAARVGMPFAALASDMLSVPGVELYWATRFLEPPATFVDDVFGVKTAELRFKDNVRIDDSAVDRFVRDSTNETGPHTIMGLLPQIDGLVRARTDLHPLLVSYGGGLKRGTIPADVSARGDLAVDAFFDEVRAATGIDPKALGAGRADRGPAEESAIDELMMAFFTFRVDKQTGARCMNFYAGAEIEPFFFSVGSLRDLYGESYVRREDVASDVFVPAPGAAIQLRDPVTDEVVPTSDTENAGILRVWNPYNVSHLHAIESEDLFSWTPIPRDAPFCPKHTRGVGLRYRGRILKGSSGGYCT
jgi:hypothetical protein